MKNKLYHSFQKIFRIQTRSILITLPVLVLGIFTVLLTLNNVYTETYDIERFNRAKETIRSPITIENESETQRKVRETSLAVEDRYSVSEEITEERLNYIEEIFEAISKLDNRLENENHSADTAEPEVTLTEAEKVKRLNQILSPEIIEAVGENIFIQLIDLGEAERQEGKEIFIETLRNTLNEGVRTQNIQTARNNVKQNVMYAKMNVNLKQVLIDLTDFAIVENSFFDPERTTEARNEAASSVDPVIIRAGEIIVREGQIITNEVYEELALVGVLDKERNIFPIVGLIIFILLITGVLAYEMDRLAKQKRLDFRKVISIIIVTILILSLMKVVSIYTTQTNRLYFLVPIATGTLLMKQLIRERMAIVLSVLYAIIGSIIFNGEIPGSLNFEAAVYFFFSQMAAIIFLRNVKDRLSIVRSGIGMAIINVLTILIFILLSFEKYGLKDIMIQSGFGVASAFLSAVLTLGLLPFFETSLGILSDIKLLSLSNPNQPLLRKLLVEAPGTYHHSIMVANLSETACEAIGANGLLARVGAYYHDIGKTVRPHYFIENQLSIKNPHDSISPKQSAEIIISHPYDGVTMLKEQRLPKEIIDIAKQHHGTSLLKYFYFQEKKNNENVKEAEFRYPGPKPQTKEAAIVCICDSVEAAVRSLKEPTEEKIEEIVASIIQDRMIDGQLDEAPITLMDLKNIRIAICESLKGIFHSRIQYPSKEEAK
ncbi:HD family phosphohydrolase [Ornithinibacillus sp. 4-3]|uniref:HD family phosphohydrolase n=1 Tax=Ornithinibacillus sp. 4-3 TaxID=3231488 RepID=A0AB39HMB2_9BACI